MKILVVGSGGREHALVYKIAQSKQVEVIFCAPGNGGIGRTQKTQCLDIRAEDIKPLLAFAKKNKIDLTVVGPEAPLVAGIVDDFEKEGLKIFGPHKDMARLEGSKVFAKEQMKRFKVPTAPFATFDDPNKAKEYIRRQSYQVVIKADGLAAGKGVIVGTTEALSAVDDIMVEKRFGPAGNSIVVEQCLDGDEASIILVTDGKDFIRLASSQDHKRVFDNDKGPNTGGMGAYSPAPVVSEEIENKVDNKIIRPIIEGFSKKGSLYKGVLYIGLMIKEGEPYVLEFNVRFGDPETQAMLPRLKTDIIDLIRASIEGDIKNIKLKWDPRACVSVVCASGGYPGNYEKGKPIAGLDEVAKIKDVVVFHAGTKILKTLEARPQYITNGGRVLAVSGLGDTVKNAIDKTYEAVKKISFEGMHYRRDIGYRAIKN
jgi:phosphoribosylamine--glycine ligase